MTPSDVRKSVRFSVCEGLTACGSVILTISAQALSPTRRNGTPFWSVKYLPLPDTLIGNATFPDGVGLGEGEGVGVGVEVGVGVAAGVGVGEGAGVGVRVGVGELVTVSDA
jgi:hypothetical protein